MNSLRKFMADYDAEVKLGLIAVAVLTIIFG